MIGQLLAGRYELQDVAGSGGMSSVYRARDTVLERTFDHVEVTLDSLRYRLNELGRKRLHVDANVS